MGKVLKFIWKIISFIFWTAVACCITMILFDLYKEGILKAEWQWVQIIEKVFNWIKSAVDFIVTFFNK